MKKTLLIVMVWVACIAASLIFLKTTRPTQKEYQFNVDHTGYDIYSDGKLIGRLNYGTNPSLDSLIDKDNE